MIAVYMRAGSIHSLGSPLRTRVNLSSLVIEIIIGKHENSEAEKRGARKWKLSKGPFMNYARKIVGGSAFPKLTKNIQVLLL